MNDSNNVFDNDNVSQTPQTNNTNNVNPTTVDTNTVFGINTTSVQSQNEITQPSRPTVPIQPQSNFNTQVDNTISNKLETPVSTTPQPIQNNISQQQTIYSSNIVNDDDLLRAFIGNNYEKITTKPFNFAGCFFNSLYMCYRKMFGYGILAWLLYLVVYCIVNSFAPSLTFIITIGFCIAIGFFVNKIYLSYAKKKIAIIKASNQQKSNEELKTICATKGGTSGGKIFLGLLAQFGISLVALLIMALIGVGNFIVNFFDPSNWNITVTDGNGTTETDSGSNSSSTTNGTLLENVSVNGYGCMGSKCNVTIESSDGNSEDYVLDVSNSDFFNKLGDYKDYIKLDIYYSNKTIVGYKIYLKSNNEDISNVTSESELREKIGLYSIGTHTDTLKLREIGTTGFGFVDDKSYTYTEYTFIDTKNNEYEMKYIDDNGELNLIEGEQYTVTFEVSEGTFDYEYIIKNINQ